MRHRCWWCYELFDEDCIKHYKSGYLCPTCKCYLETQTGDKEIEQ